MHPRTLILGTAGHIDHGKTALVRALTGIDTDRLPEEKQRGITVDIGFATLALGPFELGIVDVPGHERFVKNMLAGAVGVDLALLVVAADDSVMPQTREHLAILRLLGVRHGVIAITKCDRAEAGWIDLVEEEIRRLVAGTFLESAPIVRTAVSGDGNDRRLPELRAALEAVCRKVVRAPQGEMFRLPIDRSFSVPGRGTVVTGTVWSGQLRLRDEVAWLSGGKKLVVRGLQTHGRDAEVVERGQRAAVNLIGAHHSEMLRGHELATPGFLVPSKLLSVELLVLSDSPRAVKHRSRQRLYLGTQEVMVTVALLEQSAIEPGGRGLAQLHCAQPAVATAGQPFVLRAESPLATIGGGIVLQPCARRIRRPQTEHIERLRALASADDADRAAAAIYFYGAEEWLNTGLCRDAKLNSAQCHSIVEQLEQSGVLVPLTAKPRRTLRLHRDVLETYVRRMLDLLEQLHAQAALQTAIPRERVAASLDSDQTAAMCDAILDRLIERGVVRGDQHEVALAGFAPQLSTAQSRLREQFLNALREAGPKPPSAAELARQTSCNENEAVRILSLCASQGELVPLGDGLYLHADIETAMRDLLREPLGRAPGLTVSEIRDLLGTSRKFAVPICEHLDRVGFTQREQDLRTLR